MLPTVFAISTYVLPSSFFITGVSGSFYATSFDASVCVICGSVGGSLIGSVAEYYTSASFSPVKHLAHSCTTGAATNIISGLALGYESSVLPSIIIAVLTYISFQLCDLYGIALVAIGMLSTLATALSIDAFGPVCDNAGGIAEMAQLDASVRRKTDALDAAGNTTAAIGKGFAIGSAALVSLALFGAFTVRIKTIAGGAAAATMTSVSILDPLIFAFLLVGATLPYWFSAMTMKSVGKAAMLM
jgi:H+-translocating diphosphatase